MEGRLLGLGEEIIRVAVEHHLADHFERHDLFGDQLGGVEHVEFKRVGGRLVEGLDGEFPLGKIAFLDRLEQIAAVEVGIGAVDLDGFVPDHRRGARGGAPVEFHKGGFARVVDEAERVDAETLDHPQRARDGTVRHHPGQHVHAFRHQRSEIPERVMRRGGLRIAAVRLHFHRMDKVGEFDRILDEEDRDVVADEVEIALIGIEFHRETANVARHVSGSGAARHRGEADKYLGLLGGVLQETGLCQPRHRFCRLEISMRTGAARVHDALRNPFMVEMGDLFAQDEVFEQRRAAGTALERVLVVGDAYALVGRQRLRARRGDLMGLAAVSNLGRPFCLWGLGRAVLGHELCISLNEEAGRRVWRVVARNYEDR